MTVALLGIGADTTNSAPTPPVYRDGTFEYIPIPESAGPNGTTETKTFGNTPLRHQDGTFSKYLRYIEPRETDGARLTGEDLANWPLHHDPNFDALTYGESASRAAYTKRMRRLSEGDIAAFYTGLRGENSRYRHRYIIGYFTVNEVVDFQNLQITGDPMSFSHLPASVQIAIMDRYSANAHAKRFKANGPIADTDGLVLLDGKEPGGLLDRAFRISEHGGGGHHHLKAELEDVFNPEPGGNPNKNAYLGGIKPAHILNVDAKTFMEIVG